MRCDICKKREEDVGKLNDDCPVQHGDNINTVDGVVEASRWPVQICDDCCLEKVKVYGGGDYWPVRTSRSTTPAVYYADDECPF